MPRPNSLGHSLYLFLAIFVGVFLLGLILFTRWRSEPPEGPKFEPLPGRVIPTAS